MVDEKRMVTLSPSGATLAEQVRNTWSITAEFKVTREDIENPGYWAHVAHRLRPKDRIEVHSSEGKYYAEYMVISCDRTWAKVMNILFIDLTMEKKSAIVTDDIMKSYSIKWRGPRKWSVLRNADNAVLHEGQHTQEDCIKWLEVHLKTLGIAA